MDLNYPKVALAIGISIYALDSYAADNYEEKQPETLVITAQKVTENEQDVGISTTIFSGYDVEKSGTTNTQEMISRVPNVSMVKAGNPSDASFISMRGVSPAMGGQTVQFLVDGVSYYTFDSNLLDIERVEVLRGPQGTLYGRNASSGVINVITKKPDFITEGKVGVTIGNYNDFSTNLILGGPVAGSEAWAYRSAFEYTQNDGYFTQAYTGEDTVDSIQNFDGKVKLRYAPADSNWDVTNTLAITEINNGNTSFANTESLSDNSHDVYSDIIGHSDGDILSGSVSAYREGDSVNFTSLTSYTYENKNEYYDLDFDSSDSYEMTLDIEDKQTKLSQELRWSSKQNSELSWLAGVYFQHEEKQSDIEMPGTYYTYSWDDSYKADSTTNNMASFGNLTYALTDKLDLLLGLRFDYENIDYDYVGVSSTYGDADYSTGNSYSEFQPKMALNYHASNEQLYYASISRGYKSGGFYIEAPSEEYAEYDPEFTMNYEVGIKSEWLNKSLIFNSSLYWIEWTDQQVEISENAYSYIENAASTVSRGVEANLSWHAQPNIEIFVNGAYSDAYFKDYTSDGEDYSGNTTTNAPNYTYSIGMNYSFFNNYFIYSDYNVTGDSYFDIENTKKQDAYGLLNIRAGYSNDAFDVTLWVKNVLDQDYLTRAIYFDSSDTWYGRSGDPRTFGLTANYKW